MMNSSMAFLIICVVGSVHCVPRLHKRAVEEPTASEPSPSPTSAPTSAPSPENKPTGGSGWSFNPDVQSWVDNVGNVFTATGSDHWVQDVNTWFTNNAPSWIPFGKKPE